MIEYPHIRQRNRLIELRHISATALQAAPVGFASLMTLAQLASFEYALDFPSQDSEKQASLDLYVRSIDKVIETGAPIPPQLYLMFCGLGAYLESRERTTLYHADPAIYSTILNQRTANVHRLYASVTEAVSLAATGHVAHARAKLEEFQVTLRPNRLKHSTYAAITSIAYLLNAHLVGLDDTKHWRYRESFIHRMTVRKRDLYHPAGLLDLHALAVCDAAPSSIYRPPFVPIRPALAALRAA